MTVITLARQVGSGGHAIATALSEQCSLRVIDRNELRAEAERQGLSLPDAFVRFASEDEGALGLNHYLSYGELEFDVALRGGFQTDEGTQVQSILEEITAHSREILLTLQILIYKLAAEGNVLFVGAGAQILLADVPQVLRVKIIAPVETRIERMTSAYSLSIEEARTAVLAGDQEQVDYNRVVFGEDWHNAELWDLVINSDVLLVDQIVDLIASLPKPASEIANVSTYLSQAAAINRTMLETTSLGNTIAHAMPTPDGIVIRGDVPNDDLRVEIMELASSLSPVTPVSDRLKVNLFS